MFSVYVVEDMAFARAALEDMLVMNNYAIAGSSAKAEIAWQEIQQSTPDLILLDINLAGEKNGVWLAEQVRAKLQIPIVFLTAYGDDETLKEVMHTNPDGYVMKPYNEPTLLTTLQIAINNFAKKQGNYNQNDTLENGLRIADTIYARDGHSIIKLLAAEIVYVQSDGNYLRIKLIDKNHLIRCKLSDFVKKLPNSLFVQVHNRYAVNKHFITEIRSHDITLGGFTIPISKAYKEAIKNL